MRNYLIAFGVFILVVLGVLYALSRQPQQVVPMQGDGVHLGFIRSVSDNGRTIHFDDARWLSGKDAEDAAIANGVCTEKTRSECIPNDYYILNVSSTTEPYSLTDDAIIAMMTMQMEKEGIHETDILPDAFEKLINDESLHWNDLPYQILVEQGKVTIIEEVYVP